MLHILMRLKRYVLGTRIFVVFYFIIFQVVNTFESSTPQAISKSQAAFSNAAVKSGLIFIKTHYSDLPEAITKLEKSGVSLADSLRNFEEIKLKITNVPGNAGGKICKKLNNVVEKNPDLNCLVEVKKIHEGEPKTTQFSTEEACCLKYAPVTSCDVERSFSKFKEILSDRRHNLLPNNIEKYLITSWHSNTEHKKTL